jgi:hypothetical protein
VSGGRAINAALPVGSYPFDPSSCSGGVLSDSGNYVIDHYTGTLNVLRLGITTTALANAPVAKAYTATLSAAGGRSGYTWTLANGSLPAGLKLTATGSITGTPTTVGSSTFTVRVTDSSSPKISATRTFTLTVVPMSITTASLADGKVKKAYSQTLQVSGGKPAYTFAVTSGALPPGLKIAPASGTISGTPTTAGTYTFTVRVTDKSTPANTATRTLTIVIRS